MLGVQFQNTFSARISANGCTGRWVKISKISIHTPVQKQTWLNYFFELLKNLWIWLGREQWGYLAFRFKTNIRAKYERLLHIINKLNPHGERGKWPVEWGSNCCFWRAACFRSEVSSRNGRRVQYFLIKAQHYPKILSRGKQDSWPTPGFLQERGISTQCSQKALLHSSLPCWFVTPPQITSALLKGILAPLQTMESFLYLGMCVLQKRWIQNNTIIKTRATTAPSLLKGTKESLS